MASTNIDYDRWKEGEGYDLEALAELEGAERLEVEQWLFDRAGNDWRDLEAMLSTGSDRGRAAALEQLRRGTLEQRLHAARLFADDENLARDYAPDIEAAAVAGLESALLFYGLSIALDLATTLRTPTLIDALFRAALRDEGEAAVHAAARLAYIHGKAKEPFDWELRPLFLRFNTQDRAEREVAFRDLCTLCGVDAQPYLAARP